MKNPNNNQNNTLSEEDRQTALEIFGDDPKGQMQKFLPMMFYSVGVDIETDINDIENFKPGVVKLIKKLEANWSEFFSQFTSGTYNKKYTAILNSLAKHFTEYHNHIQSAEKFDESQERLLKKFKDKGVDAKKGLGIENCEAMIEVCEEKIQAIENHVSEYFTKKSVEDPVTDLEYTAARIYKNLDNYKRAKKRIQKTKKPKQSQMAEIMGLGMRLESDIDLFSERLNEQPSFQLDSMMAGIFKDLSVHWKNDARKIDRFQHGYIKLLKEIEAEAPSYCEQYDQGIRDGEVKGFSEKVSKFTMMAEEYDSYSKSDKEIPTPDTFNEFMEGQGLAELSDEIMDICGDQKKIEEFSKGDEKMIALINFVNISRTSSKVMYDLFDVFVSSFNELGENKSFKRRHYKQFKKGLIEALKECDEIGIGGDFKSWLNILES